MDFQVDALYFQARESGVAYAIVDERVVHPGFESHFGVRARAGADVGCDCWKVSLQYLHYHARVRDSLKGEVLPTWGYSYAVLEEFVPKVDSLWRLHMGLLDLLLGKAWQVGCLDLSPYFGLRYSEIRNKIEVDYAGALYVSMKDKTFGFGPVVGCEGVFWAWECFGVYSRFAADLLYTKVYVHQDENGARGKLNTLCDYWQVRPQFEGAVGIDVRWGLFFCRVAGELYFFPGENQLRPQGDWGDLSLHGLSFGVGLEF